MALRPSVRCGTRASPEQIAAVARPKPANKKKSCCSPVARGPTRAHFAHLVPTGPITAQLCPRWKLGAVFPALPAPRSALVAVVALITALVALLLACP